MSGHLANIEKLLSELDPKYLDRVEDYLNYLIFLQEKEARVNIGHGLERGVDGKARLKIMQQFKGDAPFPDAITSKHDTYLQ